MRPALRTSGPSSVERATSRHPSAATPSKTSAAARIRSRDGQLGAEHEAAVLRAPRHHEPVGLREVDRAQHHPVQEGREGDRGAYTEGQRTHRERREAGAPPQRTDRALQIVRPATHPSSSLRPRRRPEADAGSGQIECLSRPREGAPPRSPARLVAQALAEHPLHLLAMRPTEAARKRHAQDRVQPSDEVPAHGSSVPPRGDEPVGAGICEHAVHACRLLGHGRSSLGRDPVVPATGIVFG